MNHLRKLIRIPVAYQADPSLRMSIESDDEQAREIARFCVVLTR